MVLSRTREPVPAPIGCIQGLRHGDAALPCSAQLRIQAYLEDQGHWRVFQAARLPVLWSRASMEESRPKNDREKEEEFERFWEECGPKDDSQAPLSRSRSRSPGAASEWGEKN